MITATSKGESYMAQIETPENEEEALLKAIVNIGAPVSIEELHRTTKMSTNQCEKLAKRLRKHGMVEITPDSAYGKVAAVASRVVKNIAASSRSVDSAKLQRMVMGNSEIVFGTPRKKPSQEEKEVLTGRRH